MAGAAKVYKGSKLIASPEVALTNFEKAKGLMFSPPKDILFKFNRESNLNFNMVFVFYPIDIIFIDDDSRVVDMKKRFNPFTTYYCKRKSMYALEVREGFINRHRIRLGDTIRMEFDDGTSSVAKPAYNGNIRAAKKFSKKVPVKAASKSKPAKKGVKKARSSSAKSAAKKKSAKKKDAPKKSSKKGSKKR